jgi:hypothetical protein
VFNDSNGSIIAVSYEARRFGVKRCEGERSRPLSAHARARGPPSHAALFPPQPPPRPGRNMMGHQARQLCPSLQLVQVRKQGRPAHWHYSRRVVRPLHNCGPPCPATAKPGRKHNPSARVGCAGFVGAMPGDRPCDELGAQFRGPRYGPLRSATRPLATPQVPTAHGKADLTIYRRAGKQVTGGALGPDRRLPAAATIAARARASPTLSAIQPSKGHQSGRPYLGARRWPRCSRPRACASGRASTSCTWTSARPWRGC